MADLSSSHKITVTRMHTQTNGQEQMNEKNRAYRETRGTPGLGRLIQTSSSSM